ncbi:uncharacterized protein LOC125043722 [Penaeus chinensis]|uniref:uncharacterized protein LOC125043722 n=1 Tax=Penaeus chinensis TaxID=139456 RepID=UPI001FB83E62|nr:uncharacterized protein LOC125043722 [Penaeus chinensis]
MSGQIPGCSPVARSEVNCEVQVSDTDCMSRLGRRCESEGGPRGAGHGRGHWGAAGPGTSARQPAGPRDDDGTPLIRLLVLGGHGVGKSAVTVRYLTRRFIGEYKSQVDIIYRQTLEVDGVKVHLEIIDISSRPGDDTLPTLEICQCDCYLVVYSVADRRTFVTANQLLHAIFKLRPNMPFPTITLLGNKQDLEHSRQVAPEEGEIVSRSFGCAFSEVSVAETSEDIIPIFTSLIRRARMASFLCPHSPRNVPDQTRTCSCSYHKSFQNNSNGCRHCRCSNVSLGGCASTGRASGHSGKYATKEINGNALKDGELTAGEKCKCNRKPHRKTSRSNSKKLAVRSFSSPVSKSGTVSDRDRIISFQRNASNVSLSQTFRVRESKIHQGTKTREKDEENYQKIKVPQTGNFTVLYRSLSSPDSWPELFAVRKLPDLETDQNSNAIPRTAQEPRLLTRGRSFIFDNSRPALDHKCSCGFQIRTSSFKSSGKIEIVNIKNPKVDMSKKTAKCDTKKHFQEHSVPGEKSESDVPCQEDSRLRLSTSSSVSKSPRSMKNFGLDPLDSRSVDDSAAGARQRKFSVFGVGRALGNFLSKGSMPDLPRATANFCDRFGSLKKTIKKRSV